MSRELIQSDNHENIIALFQLEGFIDFKPITIFEVLSLAISFLGFAAIATSIIILYRQTKELSTQTKHNAIATKNFLMQRMFDVDEIFLNNPDMRPYFYDQKTLSDGDPLFNKVEACAEYMIDFFVTVSAHKTNFPEIFTDKEWLNPYIRDCFANSYVLCDLLETYGGDEGSQWYTHDDAPLKQLLNEGKNTRVFNHRSTNAADTGNKAAINEQVNTTTTI